MQDTLNAIRKQYNDEAIFLLNQFPRREVISIPTGSLLLDKALGVGGIPLGRYTEVFGVEGSGKTTLSQHLIANAQSMGYACCFIDVESAVDLNYAEACGVDVSKLLFSQPSFAEEALGIAEMLIRGGEVKLIVLDSIAALSPEKESEDEFEDKMVTGMQRAKLLAAFFRRTATCIRKENVAVILTNQMRANIGAFFGGLKPPGGQAIKHYASVRIQLSRLKADQVKSGSEIVGQDIRCQIVKNKVASPYKESKFTIIFGEGIDRSSDTLTCALELGVVQKRGAYLVYDGETFAQGKVKGINYLKGNPELLEVMREECMEVLNNE